MNNGKVRIYDLSKELELENKDILEICSELAIAVKSHSSTITESQAESIRNMAKTHSPSSINKNKERIREKKENQLSMADQLPPKENLKKQEEILAVHKHYRPSSVEATDQGEIIDHKPDLLTPPRPSNVSVTDTVSQSLESPKSEPISVPELNQLQNPPARPNFKEKSKTQIEQENKSVIKPKKPKLIDYQDNSSDHSLNNSKSSTVAIVKPKIKSIQPVDKLDQKSSKYDNTVLKGDKPKLPGKSPNISGLNLPDLDLNKPKPKITQAPIRPKSSESELEIDDLETTLTDEAIVDEEIDPEVTLLEKPKRLKQKQKKPTTKVGAVWEDEDSESALKAKQVQKAKRKSLIVDEDEDLEDLEDGELGLETVSLALARPSVPKSSIPKAKDKASPAKKPKPKLEKTEVKAQTKTLGEKQKLPETIILSESLTLRELASRLNTPETDIIKMLFFKGIAVNITETLDLDTARMVVNELGVTVETQEKISSAIKTEMLTENDLENLQNRPPVVTIMGHVDHGKTTLLDSIRNTKVAQKEAGGITQHIGAYHVDVEHEGVTQQVVFLDTPGHEAFTAMRARGAKITDIAILVVAADDGVRPQTREAISHARAAKVPILVAINKIDKPGANPDRVKQELSELGLVPEDWGGDTVMVSVSALKGENLDGLLEMIVLVAEMEDLSANPNRHAKGTVIEAHLDRTRGPIASLLVQNGTLRVGDVIVAGSVAGRIRAMIDDQGNKVEEAYPSFAVEILGLNEVPAAGDEFDVYPNEKEAKAIAQSRTEEKRDSRLQQALSSRRVTLSTLSEQAQQGELKELNLILKADVQGSVEAILGSLKQLPQKEVQIRVLLAAPGEITETDIDLAAASGAVVVGFNTSLASGARQAAELEGVDIREYDVIYKLFDEIQGAMEGLLDPEEVEESLGIAQVRAVFAVGRGAVAGCYVQSGKLVRNRFIRVVRQGEVIYQGNLDSLRRVKDDVKEVSAGYECGIATPKFNDWQDGDLIEAYEMVFKRRTLSQK